MIFKKENYIAKNIDLILYDLSIIEIILRKKAKKLKL